MKKELFLSVLLLFAAIHGGCQSASFVEEAVAMLKPVVLENAEWAIRQPPITVTASRCERSAGGLHDFYSEGDYWWPDSTNIDGPYVQRDGMTNPQNFTEHRRAMIRLSSIIGALTSAFLITHDERYAKHALVHLRAWFIDEATRMNPNLQYAQAIKGRVTGRGIGIIDTIHLLEVVQGASILEKYYPKGRETIEGVRAWTSQYTQWLTTHPYGKDEMNAKNNHGTCWVMQVSQFAKFIGDDTLVNFCRDRYKNVLLPNQMATDGSFPLELKRTKPYGYSIFNLDAMAVTCLILTDDKEDLWNFTLADGRSIARGIGFLFPFLDNKNKWPYQQDVMYWNEWPVAQPALLFGAVIFQNKEWLQTWKRLDHNPEVEEVIRNLPVRNPLIWLDEYIRVN